MQWFGVWSSVFYHGSRSLLFSRQGNQPSCIDSNHGLSLLVCGRRVSCLQRSCGYARHSGSTDRSTVTRCPMSKEREAHSPGLATFESPECLTCHEERGRSCSELVRGGGRVNLEHNEGGEGLVQLPAWARLHQRLEQQRRLLLRLSNYSFLLLSPTASWQVDMMFVRL